MLQLTRPDAPSSSNSRGRRARRNVETQVVDPLDTALGAQLFLNTQNPVVVSDMGSERILRWNPAAERLFGYAACEAIGRPIDMLLQTSIARLHDERIAQYVLTGDARVLTGEAPLVVAARAKNGTQLKVELSMRALEVPGTRLRQDVLTFRCRDQDMH